MSLAKSYKCDGCGRIMPPGASCLSVFVEETSVEDETGGRRIGRRKRRGAYVGDRQVQIDLCGDCRGQAQSLDRILDRLVPPMKVCPKCNGDRELVDDAAPDGFVDCKGCDGLGEVAA